MWVVGGMQANTETSRSSARARAATTMSIILTATTFMLNNKNPSHTDRLAQYWSDHLRATGQQKPSPRAGRGSSALSSTLKVIKTPFMLSLYWSSFQSSTTGSSRGPRIGRISLPVRTYSGQSQQCLNVKSVGKSCPQSLTSLRQKIAFLCQ